MSTNYCGFGKSMFWKPYAWQLHNASCKIHDKNYKEGGTPRDRLRADVGFLWRMIEDANRLRTRKLKAVYSAIIYFVLVRWFGWLSFNYKCKCKSNDTSNTRRHKANRGKTKRLR